jgi:hypothetical protein
MRQQLVNGSGRWLVGLTLATLLCGCARFNDAGMRLVSSKLDAFLIVNGQLLTGDVTLIPDRTGRISFKAEKGVIRACSGGLRYTASFAGEIDLHCNDGTQVALHTALLSETRGYGYGRTAQGPASVAYGLSEEDARAFLSVPPGMVLAPNPKGGALALFSAEADAEPLPGTGGLNGAEPESLVPPASPVPVPGK